MAELPRIPPPTTGVEQRLDVILQELRDIRGALALKTSDTKVEPQPAQSEKQVVDLREPVEVQNQPETIKDTPKPVINTPKPGSPTPGSVKKHGVK